MIFERNITFKNSWYDHLLILFTMDSNHFLREVSRKLTWFIGSYACVFTSNVSIIIMTMHKKCCQLQIIINNMIKNSNVSLSTTLIYDSWLPSTQATCQVQGTYCCEFLCSLSPWLKCLSTRLVFNFHDWLHK